MKKILAIRGDSQKGNEVIKILEMLGGVNTNNFGGKQVRHFYFICPYTNVIKNVYEENMLITDWETHTLKSFNEEYPYKTGDKFVILGRECSIVETFWNGFNIYYKVDNGLYLMEYSAERIQELAAEKTYEARVRIIPGKSNLQIFEEVYDGLDELEKIGYPINDMTCADLKKLLYKKIVD